MSNLLNIQQNNQLINFTVDDLSKILFTISTPLREIFEGKGGRFIACKSESKLREYLLDKVKNKDDEEEKKDIDGYIDALRTIGWNDNNNINNNNTLNFLPTCINNNNNNK